MGNKISENPCKWTKNENEEINIYWIWTRPTSSENEQNKSMTIILLDSHQRFIFSATCLYIRTHSWARHSFKRGIAFMHGCNNVRSRCTLFYCMSTRQNSGELSPNTVPSDGVTTGVHQYGIRDVVGIIVSDQIFNLYWNNLWKMNILSKHLKVCRQRRVV